MNDQLEDLILEIIDEWSDEQLMNYITRIEGRIADAQRLVARLRAVRRKRNKRKPLDTGARSGS